MQVYLSQHVFEVAGDPLQSSDKRTFLKEAVDYCREDVCFTFNGKQTGVHSLYVGWRILFQKETYDY